MKYAKIQINGRKLVWRAMLQLYERTYMLGSVKEQSLWVAPNAIAAKETYKRAEASLEEEMCRQRCCSAGQPSKTSLIHSCRCSRDRPHGHVHSDRSRENRADGSVFLWLVVRIKC